MPCVQEVRDYRPDLETEKMADEPFVLTPEEEAAAEEVARLNAADIDDIRYY